MAQDVCLDAKAIVTAGDPIMTSSKMPRRFWSYTAGKGSSRTEEMEAARERSYKSYDRLSLGCWLLEAYSYWRC